MTEPYRLGTEEVRALMSEVYKAQKFIVVAFAKPEKELLNLGWRTRMIGQYRMTREFEAFETATEQDWDLQSVLMHTLRPAWPYVKENRGSMYFKIRPVRGQ